MIRRAVADILMGLGIMLMALAAKVDTTVILRLREMTKQES